MRDLELYPHSCDGCVHRRPLWGGVIVCQYAIDTGKLKNCRAAECTHYSQNKRDIVDDEIFAAPLRVQSYEKFFEGRKRRNEEDELQKYCKNLEAGISED